jgi:hypothetical protein
VKSRPLKSMQQDNIADERKADEVRPGRIARRSDEDVARVAERFGINVEDLRTRAGSRPEQIASERRVNDRVSLGRERNEWNLVGSQGSISPSGPQSHH